ncbi:acid phosphatase aph, 3-phytase phyB [Aspergillus sclerotioniger CBS 115572]|uniref:3-phytase n=1 Tax=Aspergillus sclerotioniger CBS 115572 TaxID=1450535 RepID=A0A317VNQ8_9EURO|nr:acid phosphatase aph, 3-phytase phyB [Aspergillus sclerotioniger CBS 115572]PWY75229.1 acid phosphatase aph, 3-phytase phyB [Aspergillus sclerotioniger CBS 115572]
MPRSSLITLACALATGASAFSYGAAAPQSSQEKQFSQEFRDGYSILKHYGGNGPYSERVSYGIARDPPTGCEVDQVIMIHRHGARYPSPSAGKSVEESLAKVYSINTTDYKGDLAFLNDWTYYVPNECYYNAETTSGPYAGLLGAYNNGNEYRARYGHLWDGESVVPMFSSGYGRVIGTARKFGEGFFGYNYSTNAALNIISESEVQGADSLTPTCDTDNDQTTCDNLTATMPQFKVAAARLNAQNPGMNLTETDIYNLMLMASFELNARPFSNWINAFTQDEWVSFGYVEDLNYYYCAGPGDKNMAAVGAVYANASLTLLNQGPKEAGSLFFNFAHDTNITPILAALGVLIPDEDLPLDRIPFGNPYTTGNIVPQGGHLTIERLSCQATPLSDEGIYVRLVLNEAVLPFNSCQSGPGYSCPLANYTSILNKDLPDYTTTCNVSASYPQHLSFWWNYNTTTELNYRSSPIACQEGAAMD